MRSSTNRPTTFLQKLLKILEDQKCQQFIQWLPNQNGFNILNVSGFTQNVLPVYFKHQNYSSFVRQLNMYGFNKIRTKDADNLYEHKNFKRGSKASLKKIQRKTGQSNLRGYQVVPYLPTMSNESKKQSQIQKLKQSQAQLQKKCMSLLQRNKQLLEKNQKIGQAIKQEQLKKRLIFQKILQIMNTHNFNSIQHQHQFEIQQQKQRKIPTNTDQIQKQKINGFDMQRQSIENIEFKDKDKDFHINILEQNQKFLSLDDFINIDYDQISEGFKCQDKFDEQQPDFTH